MAHREHTHISDLNVSRTLRLHPICCSLHQVCITNSTVRPHCKHLGNCRVIRDGSSFVLMWLRRHTQEPLPSAAPSFIPKPPAPESARAAPPPLRCSNTSLVTSFPLHSPGRSAIKKDLCCPLSPISPPSATEPIEKPALWGEERGSENRETPGTQVEMASRGLIRDPGLTGFYSCHRTKPELKMSSNEDFRCSTGSAPW